MICQNASCVTSPLPWQDSFKKHCQNTVYVLLFWRSLIDLPTYLCSAVLFWHSVLFYTCNVCIRLVCCELKELSFVLSGFWLLLKSKPKHYLTQQWLWWKFLLEAALSQLTVGIVLGFWCITLCQNLGNYPAFAFVLLHFVWTVHLLKWAIRDHFLNIKSNS